MNLQKQSNDGRTAENSAGTKSSGSGISGLVIEETNLKAIDVFGFFRNEDEMAFLDSSMKRADGRYSVVGIRPYLTVEERNGRVYVNSEIAGESFEDVMKPLLEREDLRTDVFCPAAIGFISYGFGLKAAGINSGEGIGCRFCFYDMTFVEDSLTGKSYAVYHGKIEGTENLLADYHKRPETESEFVKADVFPDFGRKEYTEAVNRLKADMAENGVSVVNMTHTLRVKGGRSPADAYLELRKISPAPYSAYLGFGGKAVLCSSMELLLKVENGSALTRPIKGTCPRTGDTEKDKIFREALLSSGKEKSELKAVADASAEDLEKVCVSGTVEADSVFVCEDYSTVSHTVSSVRGKLRPDVAPLDALKAVFPGSSVTGVPKKEAMNLIEKYEKTNRGIYTGSIGYVSSEGCCMNVVIRTAVFSDGTYGLGVGGGITSESVPETEYDETLQKSKAVITALGGRNDGLF